LLRSIIKHFAIFARICTLRLFFYLLFFISLDNFLDLIASWFLYEDHCTICGLWTIIISNTTKSTTRAVYHFHFYNIKIIILVQQGFRNMIYDYSTYGIKSSLTKLNRTIKVIVEIIGCSSTTKVLFHSTFTKNYASCYDAFSNMQVCSVLNRVDSSACWLWRRKLSSLFVPLTGFLLTTRIDVECNPLS
jgi:hypothetical protein